MPSTEEKKDRKAKATMTSHKDRVQHPENDSPERVHLRQGLTLEMCVKNFEKQAQANAQSGQPSPNGPLKNLPDDSTTSSEADEATDASSNNGPEIPIPRAMAERYGLSARNRHGFPNYGTSPPSSSAKIHEHGQRQTSNKKDFYSKMATRIRDKGLATPKQPTSCACQTELQELQKAIKKMNDALGGLTQTLEQVVKRLDTEAQDAEIHRKGTQRLIAAANGEETPTDSEDEGASDV
ncbi:hypothetical protein ACHAPE_007165 [Trichoderma viride]